ncbi:MAG TPA: hypothetical protein VFD92_03845 [Candidatus Binatia bacterium]|nr:hypothetical protein [Candidatus Binatia bacterium]
MNASARLVRLGALALLSAAVASCGGGGGATASGGGGGGGGGSGSECTSAESFDSTWQGIQKVVLEKHGCTEQVCHGSSAQGGLDLSPDVAYRNLFQVKSSSSPLDRIYPGDKDRSLLWLKLAKGTDPALLPTDVAVPGAPMPNGLAPISPEELELVRQWIYAGAPETGTVAGTDKLLGACLPDAKPITITPLEAPAPGEGVQFVMAPWRLPAHSEHEICFASYYDITDQVPAEYKDPTGQYFRFRSEELRQDPQSHHLILNYSVTTVAQIHDPSFGQWTCKGGERDGQECEPTDLASCGSGLCGSTPQDGFACVGYGPGGGGFSAFQIGGAQQSQSTIDYIDGVFAQIPLKGILYWNSHAFNLTDEDHMMNARLNYYFAQNQQAPVQPIFNVSRIFAPNAAPFTTQTICNDHVLPRGARLFNLNSHTHKHGKHFTVELLNGTKLYESFVYNDPVDQKYNPPLAFDSTDPRDRTLRYCSLYNNGIKDDGSLDTDLVTRASRVPESAKIAGIGQCSPIACTAGKVGAACSGSNDDATCDSSPGAGDGECDACRITGGESTENEMFVLIGQYYLATPGSPSASVASASSTTGRSDFVGIAVPPSRGCTSSHAGHMPGSAGEGAAESAHAAHDHAAHGG